MSEENPSPPAPPSKELLAANPSPPTAPSAEGASLTDFLRRRLETMEAELAKERERARESEAQLRRQGAARGEADRELKTILEQLKAEKTQREREEEKFHAEGRIE